MEVFITEQNRGEVEAAISPFRLDEISVIAIGGFMSQRYDCVIIGGSPVGLTAGYAMRAAVNTVCIEKDVPGGQVGIAKSVGFNG